MCAKRFLIFENSTLKQRILEWQWLEREIPYLVAEKVPIRPFWIVDCSFAVFAINVKTGFPPDKTRNQILNDMVPIASKMGKPTEFALSNTNKNIHSTCRRSAPT